MDSSSVTSDIPSIITHSSPFTPDFLVNFNTQILKTMALVMDIQKQNIEGLNSIDPHKTERLIQKVQKDPSIIARANQLNAMHGHTNIIQQAPFYGPSKREAKPFHSSSSCFEETIWKKRRLNDSEQRREISSPGGNSDGSVETDWSDYVKTPKKGSIEGKSISALKMKMSKLDRMKSKDLFAKAGAFSKCKN